ncbi:hypothetical protein TspCOW1_20740 [Thiohalobacter sp. COW1]|uniref:O-antigen ligase family protein n=1 Tax=Thiohalobacter sp. COW1 TaxID=2795687 RepID=UPI001915E100|nr:O-antigen ligase family protein [Thiohalobacter sp. COW1]BCO31971.1 hypothetical protein TspCOW1_20740 [Thiohalobacter sp. COW1]
MDRSRPAVIAAHGLFALLLLSLPPKWASLHISGGLLVLALLLARRGDWRRPALRGYLAASAGWLVPVTLAGIGQQFIGMETASSWADLVKLNLRLLGVGLGILLLLERGWLSLRGAVWIALAALAVTALSGHIDWLQRHGTDLQAWPRPYFTGLAGNPNPYGSFAALGLILSAGLLRARPSNVGLWLLAALLLSALWGSDSRGAVLASLTGLLVLFWPWRHRLLAGLALLAIALVYTYVLTGGIPADELGSGDQRRIEAAWFALHRILESPLLGWGIDAFRDLPGAPLNSPHNLLLDLALGGGLLALAGWLWSTGRLALMLERDGRGETRLMLALLATAVVAGCIEYPLLNSTHFLNIWMLVTVFAWGVLRGSRPEHRPG